MECLSNLMRNLAVAPFRATNCQPVAPAGSRARTLRPNPSLQPFAYILLE